MLPKAKKEEDDDVLLLLFEPLSLIVSMMCDVRIPPKNETLSAVDTDTAFSPNENLDSIIILKGVILTVLVE